MIVPVALSVRTSAPLAEFERRLSAIRPASCRTVAVAPGVRLWSRRRLRHPWLLVGMLVFGSLAAFGWIDTSVAWQVLLLPITWIAVLALYIDDPDSVRRETITLRIVELPDGARRVDVAGAAEADLAARLAFVLYDLTTG